MREVPLYVCFLALPQPIWAHGSTRWSSRVSFVRNLDVTVSHKAPKLIAWGKLTFVVLHRVGGEAGLFFAEMLADLYHAPSIST